jgi:hypothetical protein
VFHLPRDHSVARRVNVLLSSLNMDQGKEILELSP